MPEKLQVKSCYDLPSGSINIHPEFDEFAFMHSSVFEKIFGVKKKEASEYQIGAFLRLQAGNKKVYLRYHGLPKATKDIVLLSYTNLCKLGIAGKEDVEEVNISKSNWFVYNWMNPDISSRWNFRLAIIGGVAIFLPMNILDLISLFRLTINHITN